MNWWLWLIFALVLLFGFVAFRGAPYVPSHRREAEHALDELYPLGANDLLVDVGSGDGIILKLAAARGASAVGYELNPLLVLISKFRLRRLTHVKVRLADFWLTELPLETTVVYAFIVTRDSRHLTDKLQREATRLGHSLTVISYGNQLPHHTGKAPAKLGAHFRYEFSPTPAPLHSTGKTV